MKGREGYHQSRIGRWRPNARQRRVLDALAENKSNAEIASLLGFTLDGAKWHVGELLNRTGFSDRQELARWWIEERERKNSLFAGPLVLRLALAGLALGIGVAIIAVIVVFPGSDQSGPNALNSEGSDLLGPDLPPTATWTPPETLPVPAAYHNCPVSLPNGSDPPGESRGRHFGNGVMWTFVGDDGRLFVDNSGLDADGSMGVKWVWWTTLPGGDFSIDAIRLDGPGRFISGEFHPGIAGGGTPVWVGGPRFSDAGCWQVTAHLGDASQTAVVFLQVVP